MNETDVYRLEAVLALAAAFPGTRRAAEIARQRGVPEPFLSRLLSGLARSGVVVTTRGPNGGARLARPPEQVPLVDLLPSEAPRSSGSPAVQWLAAELAAASARTLEPLSVATLLAKEREQDAPGSWEV